MYKTKQKWVTIQKKKIMYKGVSVIKERISQDSTVSSSYFKSSSRKVFLSNTVIIDIWSYDQTVLYKSIIIIIIIIIWTTVDAQLQEGHCGGFSQVIRYWCVGHVWLYCDEPVRHWLYGEADAPKWWEIPIRFTLSQIHTSLMTMLSPKWCWRSTANFGHDRSKCSAISSPLPQCGGWTYWKVIRPIKAWLEAAEVSLFSLNWWASCGRPRGRLVLGWPVQHMPVSSTVFFTLCCLLLITFSMTVRWSPTIASSLIRVFPCQYLPLIDCVGSRCWHTKLRIFIPASLNHQQSDNIASADLRRDVSVISAVGGSDFRCYADCDVRPQFGVWRHDQHGTVWVADGTDDPVRSICTMLCMFTWTTTNWRSNRQIRYVGCFSSSTLMLPFSFQASFIELSYFHTCLIKV